MKTSHDWIITEDHFMKPSYRISPFSTEAISVNANLDFINPRSILDDFFAKKFPNLNQQYLLKARHGITLALEDINLNSQDNVAILTSTGNKYISGCVTNAVEHICGWGREINHETKAVIIIHEFGKIYPRLDDIYNLGLPVIEDFAHSFNSFSPYGHQGDYIIYSFPKYFPIQYGGVILSRNKLNFSDALTSNQKKYIVNVVSEHIAQIESYAGLRRDNYSYLINEFSAFNCTARFGFESYETPSVFMFCPPADIDLIALKVHMQKNGIESSVFYGEHAFFIPSHHRLMKVDLDYFVFIYRTFINSECNEN